MGRAMVENMIEKASDGQADVRLKTDGTMDIATKDGSLSMGTDLHKDWPKDVPSYAGATVTYSASMNETDDKTGMALVLMTTDTTAVVHSFYETELKRNGWTITNAMQGDSTAIITAEKDGRQLSIAISESEGQTGITLAVESGQ